MTNGITKTVQKKAKSAAEELARKVAKTAKEEREGYAKVAKSQIVGESAPGSNESGAESVIGDGVSDQPVVDNHQKDKETSIKRIQELESELKVEEAKRKEKEEKWRQEQEGKMQSSEKSGDTQTVILLPSSPSKRPGVAGVVKGKQGTREMGKKIN